ncbi:MAG: DUF3024 domain-containing protein [Flavobacteriales bacterium]|nr:DUF3024 domain-containing protein [Flavobacteriales bacterium]
MKTVNIIEKQIADFIEKKRPPVEVRGEVDLAYSMNDETIELFEIRPQWNDQSKKIQSSIARTKYVKSKKKWKVYWMPSNLKWTLYTPAPEVKTINDFIELLEKDDHHCFWG